MEANGAGKAADSQASTGYAQTPTPAISLPKGGGAIRGIGEKFSANPATGTGAVSVPIAVSPGRAGFTPQLALSYDSGAGNGIFGLGWQLALPAITRKTEKGLPRYGDDQGCDAGESDVFILAGAEDLVPVLAPGCSPAEIPSIRCIDDQHYEIRRYRPRVESLFARIECWRNLADETDCFWRSISRDNITTWYGRTRASRICDPADPRRIFSWLICESYDDKGNVIVYRYKPEDSAALDTSRVSERNRTELSRSANRYPKHICYGNRTPYFPVLSADQPFPAPVDDWLFEVVFDYGEHAGDAPLPTSSLPWTLRNDPFSSYRAGFEVRTYRLCQRVLMFHHFPDEPEVGADCLVRSTDFTYAHEQDPDHACNPVFSQLMAVVHRGYKRSEGGYLMRAMPAVEFTYSPVRICPEVREVDIENLPYGSDGANYRWVDLDGEGLPGILTEQGEQWFYKHNLSPGEENSALRFAPMALVAHRPSLARLTAGRQQLLDLGGDGQLDLVEFENPTPGFYERNFNDGRNGDWSPFAPFESLPVVDWRNPNLKFVDLTGDGRADILISEDHAFCWHASLAEAGFGPSQRVRQLFDEEKGPHLIFADAADSIFLADFSGDGLADLARVRNGEVCYWPNLGYGRFGAKVRMDASPWFDTPDLFDPKRIRLADIDGSGVTDIIYLGRDGVRLYFNQSGNSWSAPQTLAAFPLVDNLATVDVMDLLGNGTACLVWSSPLPANTRRALRYVDLMDARKPHLLTTMVNNLGAETHVRYVASTHFYVADKLAGKPWITRIPFPVHVVERVEIHDRISRNRFVTRYAYHHGYFDGEEREFRGFGMVEQWDTETFAALSGGDSAAATNVEAGSYLPPVLTRTWFHTGAYREGESISRQYENEYWLESDIGAEGIGVDAATARSLLLPDTVLPETVHDETTALTETERREACRALKGAVLRTEVYALDDTEAAARPYSVTERGYTIACLQPRAQNRYAVFHTYACETIEWHYERTLYEVEIDGCRHRLADPRVTHALTLNVDEYGNILRSASVVYGRRHAAADPQLTAADHAEQRRTHITYNDNRYTNAVLHADSYRTPMPCESRAYELLNAQPPRYCPFATSLYTSAAMRRQLDAVSSGRSDISYVDYRGESAADRALCRRLIEHAISLYRRDDLSAPLPLGQLEALALPHENYRLAFTPDLLQGVYGSRLDAATLREAGYLQHPFGVAHGAAENGNWWIPSGQVFLSPDRTDDAVTEQQFARGHFYLPHRYRSPFHTDVTPTETVVHYDAYALLMLETRDALGNCVSAGERDSDGRIVAPGNDYRVLQPRRVMDANRNRTEVAFDALGMVIGAALMGKPGENVGDSLDGFDADVDEEVLLAHLAAPLGNPQKILQRATTRVVYDLFGYQRSAHQANPQPATVCVLSRETHAADLLPDNRSAENPLRIQQGFSYSDGFGREIQKKAQAEPDRSSPTVPRWVGTGWTIFNNKGKPVRQYEPFFSDTHGFEFAVVRGVSPVLFYDAMQRVVATQRPNRSWDKVVLDPWKQATWDNNDTVLLDPRSDPDVQRFFRALPERDYLPTWYGERAALPAVDIERQAADKTKAHANTPTIVHFDSLGRAIVSIADNGEAGKYASRVESDIEGNQRTLTDAKNRVVMRYDYDMLGNRIHQASMDAGERWMLNDVSGKLIRAWNTRGHILRLEYDALRRPLRSFVTGADVADASREILCQVTVYGEALGDARNHRGRIHQVFDGAGVATSVAYDFKGNLTRSSRQLAAEYVGTPDWAQTVPLEKTVFKNRTSYDALNRPRRQVTPDKSVVRPSYNEANLLDSLRVHVRGKKTATTFIKNIDYDARGQRQRIDYGNGTSTRYNYDAQTFRLTRLHTLRGNTALQDLQYTYDPAGNITAIRDDAKQTVFFRNCRVEPRAGYRYDATYRLIEASGREHLGLGAGGERSAPMPISPTDAPRTGLLHPGDGQALGNYRETYDYDEVGNFLRVAHASTDGKGSWRRDYRYESTSQLDPAQTSNRLSAVSVGDITENFIYDSHGNLLGMSHLEAMTWDFRDQLRTVDMNGGGRVHYVYDANGQRVRKVHVHSGHTLEERIYIGGFEIYRKRQGGTLKLERETLHVMDDAQRIALVETQTVETNEVVAAPAPTLRYQLGNHLGSSAIELDADGAVISCEEYYPFGGTAYQAGRSAAEVSLKRYRYTGKERDEETGFYYHGARYCAPWLGRWISADPKGMVDGSNLYAYVRNNPLIYSDPTGTECDPTISSCVDPSEPTAREEALQQSLPEAERYLPPVCEQPEPAPTPAAPPVAEPPPQWELGPRGEHLPTESWTGGPLRDQYTKPYAMIYAAQGNYEAAELAENYLCATCHVLTKVNPSEFSIRGYSRAWQRGYVQGFIEIPLMANPIGGAWEIGVSTGQAITGESSGLHINNISSVMVDKHWDVGRRLSTSERVWEGGTAAVGWATMGLGLRGSAPPSRGAMIGGGIPAETPISAGSTARLTRALESRMRALGIPEENIGLPQYGGRGYAPGTNTAGGNIQGVGINVDRGVLQPIEGWTAWNEARLSVRADAVIAHEWAEFGGATHSQALQLAPRTPLPISPQARTLLEDMLRMYGGGP